VVTAPIVILTCGSSGERRLQSLVQGAIPDVFCTRATGIIPACHAALRAWQRAEGRPVPREASALAVRSVRAMADSMIAVMAARHGGRTWCETATAGPPAIRSFLTVIPGARVICLHRSCESFVHSVLTNRPPDAGRPQPDAGIAPHPDRSVTAICSWWATRATSLLQLESQRPGSCARVRFEDLAQDPDTILAMLTDRLELDPAANSGLPQGPARKDSFSPADPPPGHDAGFPADQLPGDLTEKINSLHSQLGYPLLPAPSERTSDLV
jgi:hypothetical protein